MGKAKLTLLILTLLCATFCTEVELDIPKEEGILILDDSNFSDAISKNDYILVEFYATWCGHCQKFAPEYATIAKELQYWEFPVATAKIDSPENKVVSDKYGITSYPNLKLFIKGEPTDYIGGRSRKEIIHWLKKKTGFVSELVSDLDSLTELKNDHEVLIAYFGPENEEFDIFKTVARDMESLAFAHSHDKNLKPKNGKISLYRKIDEGINKFDGEITFENLKKFIEENRFPLIMHFDSIDSINRIFGKFQSAIILFSDETESIIQDNFSAAAEDNKDKIIFTTAAISAGFGQKLAASVGVNNREPSVWIVDPKKTQLFKYKLEKEITVDSIGEFIENFESGVLVNYLKSQVVPEPKNEPVTVVVGESFKEIVLNSDKSVLIEFYAPWCGHCKSLAPIYEKLAKEVAPVSGLVVAKIDATANEVEGIAVKGYPTIKFFKKGRKDSPIDYTGERNIKNFKKFLNDQLGDEWTESMEPCIDI